MGELDFTYLFICVFIYYSLAAPVVCRISWDPGCSRDNARTLTQCVTKEFLTTIFNMFYLFLKLLIDYSNLGDNFFFSFSRATPVAYGGSQARGLIRAVATGPHQSHSNGGILEIICF